VIKPLSGVLAHMQEYIGASIMNDGSTVLVVNTERLFSLRSAETVEQHLLQTS
jgi:chemotaxis protein histidine kinase CheA